MEREKGERQQGRQEVDGEKQEESWREIYNGEMERNVEDSKNDRR